MQIKMIDLTHSFTYDHAMYLKKRLGEEEARKKRIALRLQWDERNIEQTPPPVPKYKFMNILFTSTVIEAFGKEIINFLRP